MKNSRQLKDLIRNMAKEKGINAQILLRNYMLERLLERISLSEFKDHFVLKGGMLIAAVVGIDLRSTIDMDATIKSYPLSLDTVQDIFHSILSVPIDDGVSIVLKDAITIRDEADYTGVRVSLEARMDNTRIPLKVDITAGDVIMPKEMVYTFDLLLENRSIDILAYNIETIIAEKLETILSRSIANSRMRDFYDLHILLKLRGQAIDANTLTQAVQATAKRRGTAALLSDAAAILEDIFTDESLSKSWEKYRREYSYAEDISWDNVKQSVFYLWNLID
jgi:predicted nucleotidyltransferase component of viral defense system